MESDAVSARQQLDELERHRDVMADRLVIPLWRRALWAAGWTLSLIVIVTLPDSWWIFPAYAVLWSSIGYLLMWERRRSGLKIDRPRPPWTWKSSLSLLGGLALFGPAAYLAVRHDVVWPMVVLFVLFGTGMFVESLRQDRRRAEELRSS